MDSENILTRSRKIRIYPKKEDKETFKRYLGLSRYWFNKAIEHLKQEGTKASLYLVRSIQNKEHPLWAFDSPQRIREHSIADACKAVKNAKKKCLSTGQFQEVSFRSRKKSKQQFGFDCVSLKESCVFNGQHSVSFRSSELIKRNLEGTRISQENGRWFVVVPTTVAVKKPENQRLGTVALDPGVRTFQAYFSPFACGKLGQADFTRIYRLCIRLDKVVSKFSRADYKGRRRLKKAKQRLMWKIKNLVSDLHHKTASFLVRNFDTILIPTFEVSKMAPKLHSKTARAMLTWAHYRFKQFLKAKAQEYSCSVIDVNEAYTSQTCSFCGKVQAIGSKFVLSCKCGISVDRDINGARNIFLKSMVPAMLASTLSDFPTCKSKQFVKNC